MIASRNCQGAPVFLIHSNESPPDRLMTFEKWKLVRDALAGMIAEGELRPGAQLPTEAELAKRFGIGRHSVRRAITELARVGKLSVEQGRGTFVSETPHITYLIGRRTRARQNMLSQSLNFTRRLLASERKPAPPQVARALGLRPGAEVIASQRCSFVDDLPVATGWGYVSAERFPDFLERRSARGSMTALWASYGINDFLRADTSVQARPATPDEARILRQHSQMPVLVVHAVDVEPDGTPIFYSEAIWSAARVKFTIMEEGAHEP